MAVKGRAYGLPKAPQPAAAETQETVACVVRQTSAQSMPSYSTWYQVQFDTIDLDTDGMFASNAVTIKKAGVYTFQLTNSTNSQIVYVELRLDGVAVVRRGATTYLPQTYVGWVDAGAVLTVWAYTSTSGTPSYGGTDYYYQTVLSVIAEQTATISRTYGPEPVGVQAYSDTTQTLTHLVEAALALNQEDFDTDDFHSNVTNNTRLTIPAGKSGRYRIRGVTTFSANTSGYRLLFIRKNGVTQLSEGWVPVGTTLGDRVEVEATADLSVGDYVELTAIQGSGGNLSVGSATRHQATELTMHALSTYPSDRVEAPDRSIGARVVRVGYQSIPASAQTAVSWTATETDTDGFWTGALPTRLTVPPNAPSGLYQLNASVYWEGAAGNALLAGRWFRNGADFHTDDYDYADTGTVTQGSITVWAVPGDYFDFRLWNGGATRNIGHPTAQYAFARASIAYLGSGSAATQAVLGTEVTRSTAQSVAAGNAATISFDAASPSLGWWASSPNPTRVTVAETGWYSYECRATFDVPTTAGKTMRLYLRRNGSGAALSNIDATEGVSGVNTPMGVSGTCYLSAGDYVEMTVFNGDTASKDIIVSSDPPFLRLVRLANGSEATVEPMVVQDAPSVRVRSTAAQSVANGATPLLTLATVDRDTHGFVTSSTRLTIPSGQTGWYHVEGRGWWQANGTGIRNVQVLRNGSVLLHSGNIPADGANDTALQVAEDVWLTTGDYIEMQAYQSSGGSLYIGNAAAWAGNVLSLTRLVTGPQGEKGDKGDPAGETYGNWTPVATFGTPGNLSVAYSIQFGRWRRVGSEVRVWGRLVTTTWTHTTASGTLFIDGLPFSQKVYDPALYDIGPCLLSPHSAAGTPPQGVLPSATRDKALYAAYASGGLNAFGTTTVPTATNWECRFSVAYEVADGE